MEINEVWKDIIDFPNYQVSNLGRVKSKERISNCCYNSKRKVKNFRIIWRYWCSKKSLAKIRNRTRSSRLCRDR